MKTLEPVTMNKRMKDKRICLHWKRRVFSNNSCRAFCFLLRLEYILGNNKASYCACVNGLPLQAVCTQSWYAIEWGGILCSRQFHNDLQEKSSWAHADSVLFFFQKLKSISQFSKVSAISAFFPNSSDMLTCDFYFGNHVKITVEISWTR